MASIRTSNPRSLAVLTAAADFEVTSFRTRARRAA
jgi:hypothetical protein